jgi:putative oxidoreductase
LVLQLVAGTAMMLHGWPKIYYATSRMGPDASVPGIFQALAALTEFGGGLCWVLGLLTPLASYLILGEMAVALGMVHLPQGHPFVASQPGEPAFEPALGYLAIAVALLLIGPGQFSLDAWLFGRGRM